MPTASRARHLMRRFRFTMRALFAPTPRAHPERPKRTIPVVVKPGAQITHKRGDGGAGHAAACPHCGLQLTITRDKLGTRVTFDLREWERLCKFPHLDSPVLCLIARSQSADT